MKTASISDAEWPVMECIWNAGQCTAADVIKTLRDTRQWNHRTIRSLLARLVEKGALNFEVDGTRYIYRAAIPRERCVSDEGRSFLDKVFGGDVKALLLHFAGDSRLDHTELARLRKLLERKSSEKGGGK